ncbi:hypothetical protein ID866_3832 [Astraeus odoratus]|nr:hypothetical protein ID866_3832 [Astraeus odoratus]
MQFPCTMDPEDANLPTTKLLTLLNVSALKSRKRNGDIQDVSAKEKLNKRRKSARFEEEVTSEPILHDKTNALSGEEDEAPVVDEVAETDRADAILSYEQHFGANPDVLDERKRISVDQRYWSTIRQVIGGFTIVATLPRDESAPLSIRLAKKTAISERLRTPFEERQAKQPQGAQLTYLDQFTCAYFCAEQSKIQNDLLSIMSAHFDLYHPAITLEHHRCIREAVALHALDHVTKKRRRILKNSERISHAKNSSLDPPEDIQDQGFTRPSVLILVPFRSYVIHWVNAMTSHTPSSNFQVENHSRFLSEFGLPPNAVDKLATAEKGMYPDDHVETFSGNVDDNFRIGVKLTRKTIKLFAEFYGCDIVFASPLGLRMSIEKEKSADFLSSIEVLVMDQMNAMVMQNWDHVQFVLSHMNKLPNESHDTDFSRIKPWYLDGQYSSNQDISRARQAFFVGKKSFLLVSERFHFYRRYKIRGIRNIIFYSPPDHPQFFSEFLSYPFLDDGVDPSDVSCRVLYCKYDKFRLERLLGSASSSRLLDGDL